MTGAECRRLKVKCDLKFPCAHCIKRGLEKLVLLPFGLFCDRKFGSSLVYVQMGN